MMYQRALLGAASLITPPPSSSGAFNAITYTGNGGTNNVTGVGFLPDFVWIKTYSTTGSHYIFDTVRGAGKELRLQITDQEATRARFASFDADGFSVNISGGTALNNSGTGHIAMCWQKAASFLDIVTYTGDGSAGKNVSHALGIAPKMMLIHSRSATGDGAVYHASEAADAETDYALIDSDAAFADDVSYWNDTAPTSSQFTLGTNANVNSNGVTYVAYLFAEQSGKTAFGSYSGNGSTSGPTISLGFTPKCVLVKAAGTTGNWALYSTARGDNNMLLVNTNDAEATVNFDLQVGGFQPKANHADSNSSGVIYVYAAFS